MSSFPICLTASEAPIVHSVKCRLIPCNEVTWGILSSTRFRVITIPAMTSREFGPEVHQETLQSIGSAVAQEQSAEVVLEKIVRSLDEAGIALARIWLRRSSASANKNAVLNLAASAGKPLRSPGQDWSRLNGRFASIPLGTGKIGAVGAGAPAILVTDADSLWSTDREFASRERIHSFAAQPLVFRQTILGVLAVFSRNYLDFQALSRLRSFADHAAVALANADAQQEISRLRAELGKEPVNTVLKDAPALTLPEIVGRGSGLQAVLKKISLVAPTRATVLISGESGTGKELIARAIHEESLRRHRPMVVVNCASIPNELFESEFFGYAKGAFTGAVGDRAGRFQMADGGTLFLDEIGELSMAHQSKLLRVLQDGEFERLGEGRTRRVDVRIVAATNRNLRAEVEAGRFRRDLYYRLSVFPIDMPPLRQRTEDIPALADHLIRLTSGRLGISPPAISLREINLLRIYDWPGNVREMQNIIEQFVILSRGGAVRIEDLIPGFTQDRVQPQPDMAIGNSCDLITEDDRLRREALNVEAALRQSHGKIDGTSGAAALLGINPNTLRSRLKALGIRPKT